MASKTASAATMQAASALAPSDASGLVRRLEDGYARIEEAKLRGIDIRAWEDFWLQLLDEYEDVCDGLRLAAA